ncbi:MAG: hypothetical protein QMB02_02960, partial [Rhodospirillales bacterium]
MFWENTHLRLTLSGALMLLLSACAQFKTHDDQAQTNFAEPTAAEVIAIGFDNIANKYIELVSLRRIGVEGLRGLGAIDEGISLSEEAGEMVLYK